MNRSIARALAIALLTGATSSVNAALIFSESFESPAVDDSGGFATASYVPATTPGPWSSSSGNLLVYDELNYFGPATDGTQYLVTNPADGASGGTISWNFNVAVGVYTLTFDERVFGGALSSEAKVDVSVTSVTPGDLMGQTLTANGSGAPSLTPVVQFNQTFTTTSAGLVTLTLTDTTLNATSNGMDMLLDNIEVNGPPVPEPASIGLLSVAAMALGRRRRSSHAG